MKKVIFFLAVIFLISLVIAEDGISITTGSTFSFSEKISPYHQANSIEELRQMISENEKNFEEEINYKTGNEKIVYKNQKKFQQAIYCFSSMESMLPPIGILVSEVSEELNASFQKTIYLESQIISKNYFLYFFVGGNKNIANELEVEIIANRDRIIVLKELGSRCGCSEEVQKIFYEQIKNLEDEQMRLQEIVNSEKNNNGLFFWK